MINSDTIFTCSSIGNGGRLGNMLFTVASVTGIAEKYGAKAVFPKWKYSECFKNKIDESLDVGSITHRYNEPHFHYTGFVESEVIEIKPGEGGRKVIDLVGYFQSPLYFEHCKEKILQMFDFTEEVKERIAKEVLTATDYYKKIPVGIHMRFGDYKNNPYYANLVEDGYYKRAIEYIIKCNTEDEILFFLVSDEPELAAKTISEINSSIKIRQILGADDIQDMYLLSICEGVVAANSSFSWWGNFLTKQDKLSIAPKEWFGKTAALTAKDIYTDKMVLL